MKFRPEITRVKLNPEQAVLTCSRYDTGMHATRSSGFCPNPQCAGYEPYKSSRTKVYRFNRFGASASS